MNHNKTPQRHEYKKTPTAPAFSFLNSEMLRQDYLVEEGGRTRRIIIYPTPPTEKAELRDNMATKGLVLGRRLGSIGSDHEHFIIPVSARPLSYEASAESSSRFVYGDREKFFDLGKLLGQLSLEGQELPVVLDDDIGLNVAAVSFTRVNEPRILLVPGFESKAENVEDDDRVALHYTTRLHDEFNGRFDGNIDYFIEGLRSTLA